MLAVIFLLLFAGIFDETQSTATPCYDFILLSAGRDGEFGTGDDLYVTGTKDVEKDGKASWVAIHEITLIP